VDLVDDSKISILETQCPPACSSRPVRAAGGVGLWANGRGRKFAVVKDLSQLPLSPADRRRDHIEDTLTGMLDDRRSPHSCFTIYGYRLIIQCVF